MPKCDRLAPRQAAFVREYLVDLNATQAAIRAGYSRRTAEQQGPRLLGNVGVQAAVQAAQQERAKRTEITADRVLKELGKIAFANLADYLVSSNGGDPVVDLSKMTRDQAAALSEVTIDDYVEGRGEGARTVKRVRVKMADRIRAAELLGKHLGMFRDNPEADDAPMPTVVQIQVVDCRRNLNPGQAGREN